jgi:hypothetical protein
MTTIRNPEKKYRPRNDMVLLLVTDRDLSKGGVALPNVSAESRCVTVVAVGPKVLDLRPGTEVQVAATEVGHSVIGEENLFLTKESNVLLVVEGR